MRQTVTPYFANNWQLNLKTLVFMFIFAQISYSRTMWAQGCLGQWWGNVFLLLMAISATSGAEPGACLINICWMNEWTNACLCSSLSTFPWRLSGIPTHIPCVIIVQLDKNIMKLPLKIHLHDLTWHNTECLLLSLMKWKWIMTDCHLPDCCLHLPLSQSTVWRCFC